MLLAMNNKDLSLIFDELCEQTEQILKELSINNYYCPVKIFKRIENKG